MTTINHVILCEVNVKHEKKICGNQPVIFSIKTAIKSRLIDVFETLIDWFHETLICINYYLFFFNMHSNIYSCLFHDANIKEENIIDSHAAWTEANVVTSLQIKEWGKTHLLLVSDLKLHRRMRLCHNKNALSLLKLLGGFIGWLASSCMQWMALKR